MPGHWELIALALVVMLPFGSKQVRQIGRMLGRGVREVRQTVAEVDRREDVSPRSGGGRRRVERRARGAAR